MPPAAAAKPAPRRRNRKRKRRAASSSSSSLSSSSSESDEETTTIAFTRTTIPIAAKKASSASESDSESSSSKSSSSPSSSSDSEGEETKPIERGRPVATTADPQNAPRKYSPSPSPPPTELPSFLPPSGPEREKKEQAMKEKFRKFWLASVADGFKDDLEEIRKEPNLNTSRLALLIDSLASGADVFTSQKDGGAGDIQMLLG